MLTNRCFTCGFCFKVSFCAFDSILQITVHLISRVNQRLFCVIVSRQGQVIGNAYGPGNASIWLDDVNCQGNELSLRECEHRPLGSHNCQHDEDVSISCHDGPPQLGLYTSLHFCTPTTRESSINRIKPANDFFVKLKCQ